MQPAHLTAVVALAIATGGLVAGMRVARRLGDEVVAMDFIEGAKANVVSAALVGRALASGPVFRDAHTGGEASWRSYLEAFHHERPGVTERVLGHCVDQAGVNPYQWVAKTVDPNLSVLDLACGSGSLHDLMTGRWVGMDLSSAELYEATARGASPLVLGDAANLPFAAASFDVVVCSMALMLTEPLEKVLREITRVLRPGGRLVALLPASGPLRLADRFRYGGLLLALHRRRLTYPNDVVLADLPGLLDRAGLTLLEDRRRRFTYRIAADEGADQLVASLYLPGADRARITAATRVVKHWVGETLGVPLRRVVAGRADSM